MTQANQSRTTTLALGVCAGVIFTAWLLKTPAPAVAAPAVDYSAITAAVKAALPTPAKAAEPVKAEPVKTAAPTKRKAVKATAVYYVVAPHCTCSL